MKKKKAEAKAAKAAAAAAADKDHEAAVKHTKDLKKVVESEFDTIIRTTREEYGEYFAPGHGRYEHYVSKL